MTQTGPRQRAGQPRPKPNLALLEARLAAGLSRADLGALAGVTEKQIGLIERGLARDPRASTVASIATVLDRDVSEIFDLRQRAKTRRRKGRP